MAEYCPPSSSAAASWEPNACAAGDDEPTADANAEDGAVATSPSSTAAMWVPVPEFEGGDELRADANAEARALAVNLDRDEKLFMLSKRAYCQDLACNCSGWIGEKDQSSCSNPDCAHPLYSHILHLTTADDNELHRLLDIVFDIDYIETTIISLSKLPHNDRNYFLEAVYFTMHLELKQFVFPGSVISLENLFGVPPFENPSIVKILMNFNMYEFGYNSSQLRIAHKVSKIIIEHLDTWKWVSPKYLLLDVTVENRKMYEIYYQRYLAFCRSSDHIRSIRPGFRMTMIFGKNVLKYILKTFRMFLLNWCVASTHEWSEEEKLIGMNYLPKYLSLLENEVDADHSPIWDLNFKYSFFKNKIVSDTRMHFEVDEEKNTKVQDEGMKNKSFDDKKIVLSQEEKCIDSSGDNSLSEETISNLLKKVHINPEIDSVNAPRGEKARIEEQKGTLRIVVVGNSVNNKVEKCVTVWLTQLRNIFQLQLPKIPSKYITHLVFDTNHKIVALLKNDNAVGGICFRPFALRGFSEIVFCAVSAEVQGSGYSTHLMNHLKDYQTQQNILNLLTYVDTSAIGYFEKQGFSKNVKIPKKIYQNCIKSYKDASLMHCRLDPKIIYSQLPRIIRLQNDILKIVIEEECNRLEEKAFPGTTFFENSSQMMPTESIPGVLDAWWYPPAKTDNSLEEIDFGVLTMKLTEVLTFVKGLKEAEPFLKPVDKSVSDYYKLIRFPIDLSMISDKLSSGYYRSRRLFVADMKLMFSNCHKFNPPDSYLTNCATTVEKRCKIKMKKLGLSLELSSK